MVATLTSRPTNRVREYETIYILRPDVDADTADKVAGRIAEVVGRESGKLVKVENWGRRKLAYDIAKHKRGVYTYVKYLGGGPLVNELERNLRMLDSVIRYQTVLLRSDVLAEDVAIDPEETKFARLELPAEDEKEESRERLLGFLDDAPQERRPRRDDEALDDIEPDDEVTMNPDIAEVAGEEEK
jgi:small subunit ribosomal protein S6